MEGIIVSIKDINVFENNYNRERDKIVREILEKIKKEYFID